MRKSVILIMCAAAILLTACSDNKKRFNPEDRTTSSMSAAERQAAIEAKRRSLLPVDIDSLITAHSVTFSVLPPAVTENVPEAASDKLASKMIQIASQNGVSGLCTNPVLSMVSRVDCIQRELTGTAPQKAIVKYEVTMYCGNMATGDIYASSSQTLTGVGTNFDDAANNAFNGLKNDSKMQIMLRQASERAMKWYDVTGNVKAYVDRALGENKAALASAFLSTVPQESASFEYAVNRNEEVAALLFQDTSDALLAAMENAIAEGGDEKYNPEVGACLRLISQRSNVYDRAQQLYDAYLSKLDASAKERRDNANELAREEKKMQTRLALEDKEMQMRLALEDKEIQKIKVPLEAQAAIEQIRETASIQKDKVWSEALTSATASLAHGMRGGIFGENGMFGKGGIFGVGSFAEPLSIAASK